MHERFQTGELLHQKLDAVCDALWGIDIDSDGIAFLKEKGFTNLHVADITDEGSLAALKTQIFDVVVLSEVIEHLPNVGLALDALKSIAAPAFTEFLISVPNAFSVSALAGLLENTELVHSDHNCYFSHVTFSNTLRKAGYEVAERFLYSFQSREVLPPTARPEAVLRNPGESTPQQSSPLFQPSLKHVYWNFRSKLRNRPTTRAWIRRTVLKFLFRRSLYWSEGLMYVCRIPA